MKISTIELARADLQQLVRDIQTPELKPFLRPCLHAALASLDFDEAHIQAALNELFVHSVH